LVQRVLRKVDFPRHADDIDTLERVQIVMDVARRGSLAAANFQFRQHCPPISCCFAACWTRAPALSNIRARSAMRRSGLSSPLDDESMAIDVVHHQAVRLADHPIDQPGHPTARIEAVIVEYDDAAGYQPRPHPVE